MLTLTNRWKGWVFSLSVVFLLAGNAAAEDFFPMGAWWPFGYHGQDTSAPLDTAKFAQLEECGFNVVMAPLERD